MRSASCEELRQLEQAAIHDFAIPSLLLMENAGRGASEILCKCYAPSRVSIFVGKGNNGGDGLVVARYLANQGFDVWAILLENIKRLKPDPFLYYQIILKMKIPVIFSDENFAEEEIRRLCRESEFLVDAIFGVGLHSPVLGVFEKAIRSINKSEKPVISLDVPSGLDADTGCIHHVAVKANRTLTFALPKKGFFVNEGPVHTGKIDVVDIGLPKALILPYLN